MLLTFPVARVKSAEIHGYSFYIHGIISSLALLLFPDYALPLHDQSNLYKESGKYSLLINKQFLISKIQFRYQEPTPPTSIEIILC
jgi:hypothetical protein